MIADEYLDEKQSMSFAPLVDFLFLIIAVLSCALISENILESTNINLTSTEKSSATTQITSDNFSLDIGIDKMGNYFLYIDNALTPLNISELDQYLNASKKASLYIDKDAKWDHLAPLILQLKEKGVEVSPIFQKNS